MINRLNDESIRIVIYMKTLEMRIHIKNIIWMFQWKLDLNMRVDIIIQWFDQENRDFTKIALRMIFLSKINLSEKKTVTPDDSDEEYIFTNIPKSIFNLSITKKNWIIIEQFLSLIYYKFTLNKKGKRK